MIPRSLRVARWMVSAARGPWLRLAVPRVMLLALVAVELDAMLGFPAVSRQLQRQPPWVAAAACAGLCALIAVSERRAAVSLLRSDRTAVLRRQPVPGRDFGPGVAALLAPLVAPATGLGWLWHGSPWGALCWSLLALAPTTALAADRPLAALGALAPTGLVAVHQALPALGPGVAGAAALWVPVLGHWFSLAEPTSLGRARSFLGGLAGPVTALLHRDLLALWRLDRHLLLAPLVAAVVPGLVVFAMRVNGPYGDEATTVGAAIALSVVGAGALAPAAAAAGRLGPAYDPPGWPVRESERFAATAAEVALAVAPAWLAVVVAGRLPVDGQVRLAALVAQLAAGGAWWLSAEPRRPALGAWWWWCGLALATAGWPHAWPAGLVLAASASAAGLGALRRRREAA